MKAYELLELIWSDEVWQTARIKGNGITQNKTMSKKHMKAFYKTLFLKNNIT